MFKGVLEGDLKGDLEGDLERDLEGDLERDLERDLESRTGTKWGFPNFLYMHDLENSKFSCIFTTEI